MIVKEAGQQLTLVGAPLPKSRGTRIIIQGRRQFFEEIAAKFRQLAKEKKVVIKEES